MRIVYDDILYSLQKSGGGSIYWSETTKEQPFEVERIVYDSACQNSVYKMTGREDEYKHSRLMCLKRYFNLRMKKEKPFVFHSSYYRFCKDANAINITTVHDFTFEKYFGFFISFIHKIQKKRAVMHSDGVICVSENTKKDLEHYYPSYRGHVEVIYNGYDAELFRFDPESIREKKILFVGARTDYKRFDIAVEVAALMKDYKLIIIGGGELTNEEKELLEEKLHNQYEKVGFLPGEKLRELYNTSRFLCYPSEYEGFGIPVIEAQACGCPVVCQKTSSIPEVSNDIAIYINADEIFSGDVKKIEQLEDKEFYEDLQKRGLDNVKRFSWEKCRRDTTEFYKRIYNNKLNTLEKK